MNLINQNLLKKKIDSFEFPSGKDKEKLIKDIEGWRIALKDHDLSKTKETSVQGLYLVKFFGEILGYSVQVQSQDEWNLVQHPGNEVDSQEPDGSLGFYSTKEKTTRVVIELKDAMTSLDKKQSGREKGYTPIEQGYLYATKFEGCNWIIVSNFKEIRLYSKYKTQNYYEKFELVELNQEEEFKKFYYIFCRQNLLSRGSSQVDELLNESITHEENISEEFYEKYKDLRLRLFNHLLNNNLELDKSIVFEKTQKLLDRIIFILFCEDTSMLLPKNITKETYELGIKSRERNDQRVWREFKNLFKDIDEGREDLVPRINKYNGGLFAHDEILDNLIIRDEVWEPIVDLSKYDYQSDLNVNILGHIFEQSITDIENLKLKIGGEQHDMSISKRKRQGIYYTPEYITKYIVENTAGQFLLNNKNSLETITILDPACGSGAFLNQAHTFLLSQHRINFEEKLETEKKQQLDFTDINYVVVNREILLKNLYGVDLNQESVEITKLALWLKTAKSSEPLNNLDTNIKCGNSIIDDSEVAEDKAFVWDKEFTTVFNKSKFNIVIGNPPYGYRGIPEKKLKDYYLREYKTHEGNFEFYRFFIEKSITLLSQDGYLGFIIPNSFLTATSFKKLRKFLLQYQIDQIIDLGLNVFKDVVVESVILIIKNSPPKYDTRIIIDKHHIGEIIPEQEYTINQNKWLENEDAIFTIYLDEKNNALIEKMEKASTKLEKLSRYCTVGINTGYIRNEMISDKRLDDRYHKLLNGKDIGKYSVSWGGKWIIYDKSFVDEFGDRGRTLPSEEIFIETKILVQRTRRGMKRKLIACLDEDKYFNLNRLSNIVLKDNKKSYYVLALLNSKLLDYYFNKKFAEYEVKPFHLASLPIADAITYQQDLGAKAEKIQILIKNRDELNKETIIFLIDEYDLPKEIIQKVDINDLGWNEFKTLFQKYNGNKDILKMEELHNWYLDKQNKLLKIRVEIENLNKQVDLEIYKLYKLTDDEIKMIENYYS